MPERAKAASDVEVILRALSLHAAFVAPMKGGTQADAEVYLKLFQAFSYGALDGPGLRPVSAQPRHAPASPLRLVQGSD